MISTAFMIVDMQYVDIFNVFSRAIQSCQRVAARTFSLFPVKFYQFAGNAIHQQKQITHFFATNDISIEIKWSIIKVLHFVYLLFDIIIMTLEKWSAHIGLLTITWVYILTADVLRSNWQRANPIILKSK